MVLPFSIYAQDPKPPVPQLLPFQQDAPAPQTDEQIALKLYQNQEYDKAAESYKSVMNHPKTPPVLAEYSELMYLKAKLSDSASNKQELLKHLTTFVQTKPTFKSSALEILAALQIELNLMQEAKESLDKLTTDTNSPPTMKTRVEQLRNYVS